MLHFNKKLLFILLLVNATSLITCNGQDKEPEESTSSEPILDLTHQAFGTMLGCGVLKTFEDKLPTEKIIVAEILKKYITHNTLCPEFIGETIAQCLVSPVIKNKTRDQEISDKDSYEYQLIYQGSIRKTLLHSIPKTAIREIILNILTKFLHKTAKTFKIKHPPIIKKNKKLYLAGKLIMNSLARELIDKKLYE